MTTPAGQALRGNRLLAAIPQRELKRLLPHFEDVTVCPKEIVYRPGEPIRRVYFPHSGVFSVSRPLPDGSMVEAAAVGTEGFLGIEACFSDDALASGQTFLQVPGGDATSLSVAIFRRELDARGALHRVTGRYAQAFIGMVMQCVACNAVHDVSGRCARWLLMVHDRMRHGEFRLSHEALAVMIGASRPTVSMAALRLQQAGLIAYTRGQIRVLNRRRLEAAACVCYRMTGHEFERDGTSE
jgi:CRP-like cAMP-binding protein